MATAKLIVYIFFVIYLLSVDTTRTSPRPSTEKLLLQCWYECFDLLNVPHVRPPGSVDSFCCEKLLRLIGGVLSVLSSPLVATFTHALIHIILRR